MKKKSNYSLIGKRLQWKLNAHVHKRNGISGRLMRINDIFKEKAYSHKVQDMLDNAKSICAEWDLKFKTNLKILLNDMRNGNWSNLRCTAGRANGDKTEEIYESHKWVSFYLMSSKNIIVLFLWIGKFNDHQLTSIQKQLAV